MGNNEVNHVYHTFLNVASVVHNDVQTLYQVSISVSPHLLTNLAPSVPTSLASGENERI